MFFENKYKNLITKIIKPVWLAFYTKLFNNTPPLNALSFVSGRRVSRANATGLLQSPG